MQAQQLIRYEVRDGVGLITLDSPHNRNALSTALMQQFQTALDAAEQDVAVRLVVLSHTGGTFCAGMDLSEATSSAEGDPVRARGEDLLGLLRSIVGLGVPVVAAVDGHVRAGGMGLVCACDLAFGGPSSTFALNEARLGLAASVVSVVVRPRLSDREAAEVFLLGATMDAERAAGVGILTAAVPDVPSRWREVAEQMRGMSPQGLRESKRLLTRELLAGIDREGADLVDTSARLFASAEAREGMNAFLEKRQPTWNSSPIT